MKKIREAGTNDQRHESGRPKHVRTEVNVTTADELISLLRKKDQTNISFNAPDIQHSDLGPKSFFSACCLLLLFPTFIFHKVVYLHT